MLLKLTVVGCLMVLTVLNSTPPADAFGFDLLSQLTDLFFGSDESDESSETVINAKPNATVTVLCMTECNLNVTCINCKKVDTAMMKPPNGGNGGGADGSGGTGGGGNGATTAAAGMTTAAPGATTVSGAPPGLRQG